MNAAQHAGAAEKAGSVLGTQGLEKKRLIFPFIFNFLYLLGCPPWPALDPG